MSQTRDSDEKLLIDFILGRCDAAAAAGVRQRLETDAAFRGLHRDLTNTFAAMALAPELDPPADLADRTLALVRRHRTTDSLLAREKPAGRVLAPTFSLRELAAVAAAAVLVIAVFVPSTYKARRLALQGQCASNVGRIGAAIQAHASANDGYLPAVAAGRHRWLPGDNQPAVSNSVALFKLVVTRYASPVSFQCPAIGGPSFVVRAGMTDFPSATFISYSYHHTSGPNRPRLNDPRLQGVREHMAILADSTPLFDDGTFRPDRVNASAGDNHGVTGQNVLYLDMHVDWKDEASVGVNRDNIFLAGSIKDYHGTEAPAGPQDTFLLPAFSAHASLPR